MIDEVVEGWTAADAEELYDVQRWGTGYFSVARDGQLMVHPDRDGQHSISLLSVVDRLVQQGVDLPVLVRFNDILKNRLEAIHEAFSTAIADHDYRGTYSSIYPIKVNQQRQVVEEVIRHRSRMGIGLEAGSKPELLAVIAMADADMPIICNGSKDEEYIQMVMYAHQMGRHITPVIERFSELERILASAERLGIRPRLGFRVKLMARGAGRWQGSSGSRSKFGLNGAEILRACELLEARGMTDCLQLAHFHLGSQITNIRRVKNAVNEATRVYCDLVHRGMSGLQYIDVGGGLGVDYDGSQTDYESSINYTLQEYANDIIFHVQSVCDDAGVEHPQVYSESGRAIAAYHSVLVFNVVDTTESVETRSVPATIPDEYELPIHTLHSTLLNISPRNLLESLHDAQQAMEDAATLFTTGHISLEQRCVAEDCYWKICHRVRDLASQRKEFPEDLQGIHGLLSDTVYCNFSVFQSLPDSWAIDQLFPIMPIHRLNECPDRHAVLADITCDSDGKIDRFIHRRDVQRTLRLHRDQSKPYYLAAFLTGAYQEILGDLHNLFGDTNMVHVTMSSIDRQPECSLIPGDTVSTVLEYVHFDGSHLIDQLLPAAQTAVSQNRISKEDAENILRFYSDTLDSYTYLQEAPRSGSPSTPSD